MLYLLYLEKQVDPELLKKMVAKANAVEKAFNVYRAKVDGKEMTDSEVRKVLKESNDSARRKAVWEASKGVGGVVEADLKELVKLRNEAAVKLGFKNYHALQLYLNEQDGDDLHQAVRRTGRADARAVPGRQGRDRRPAGQATTASRSRT